MAEIRPFKGLRFTGEAGDLSKLVAPPYDVLSKEQRDGYAQKSPHNIVHLTLPEAREDDRSKFVKYGRSAAALQEWRRHGILKPEPTAAFYRYSQVYDVPAFHLHGACRTSLIALIKAEPYERGIVLPHEQTFPKHKEDRLRMLEATRAHLECILGLYEDAGGKILKAIQDAPVAEPPSATEAQGVAERIDPITDPDTCELLVKMLSDRQVWIADGHHRYETALNFRLGLGRRDGRIPEDFLMMALASISDPGLALLPTHRILKASPLSPAETIERLRSMFVVELSPAATLGEVLAARVKPQTPAFGLVLPEGNAFILTPHNSAALIDGEPGLGSRELRALDVSVLHSIILERILGVTGTEHLAYTRDPAEAISAVAEGAAAAFLMNPPTVDQMRTIALGGEKMPQKSTYYFPKILSGLVLWSLNDF
jgi:uncharacterized protein (DUF1015 family)